MNKPRLTIALPKGRMGDKSYALFAKAGLPCPEITEEGRKLVFESPQSGVRYLLVKPSDVAIYVLHGAADLGVVGKDSLLESEPDVYELLDMKLGACRIAVAARNGYEPDSNLTLRVATKYPRIAQKYYAGKSRDIELIKLNGSIELAPIMDLSDVIVDIVESGATLRENDLSVREVITTSTARLIANKSSYHFAKERIDNVCAALTAILQEEFPK